MRDVSFAKEIINVIFDFDVVSVEIVLIGYLKL